MSRVPGVERASLDAEGQAIFDEIAESRGHVQGPFPVLLHSPEVAVRIARVGHYIRYVTDLPARHRHLVALVAAQAQDCQYEFTVHARLARELGIPEDAIRALSVGEPVTGLDEPEATIVAFARQLTQQHRVDDATFQALQAAVGLPRLTELVATIGYFSMIAFPLNAFGVGVREGHAPELPLED